MNSMTIMVLVLLFFAVVAGVYSAGALVNGDGSLRQRLRNIGSGGEKRRTGEWQAAVLKIAEPLSRLAVSGKEDDVSRLRARFMQAGFRNPSAPVYFFAAKAILAIALPLLLLLLIDTGAVKLAGNWSMVALLTVAAIGYYAPNAALSQRVRLRQRDLFESFPDALDLIIVCVEAGLSLDLAIARASSEMGLRSTALADELNLVTTDLRILGSRDRALRNLASRTGLEEISSFVAMMLQADRFGTSIADALRVHADTLRVRRRQRAEEQAAKLPLKLMFPLIFCVFPSMLLVLLGPSMLQITRILFPAMSGP